MTTLHDCLDHSPMRVAGNESRLDLRYNEITWEYCMIVLMAEILHCFGWLVLLNCFASSFWMRFQCEIQKRQLLPRLYDTKLLFVLNKTEALEIETWDGRT